VCGEGVGKLCVCARARLAAGVPTARARSLPQNKLCVLPRADAPA